MNDQKRAWSDDDERALAHRDACEAMVERQWDYIDEALAGVPTSGTRKLFDVDEFMAWAKAKYFPDAPGVTDAG